MSMHSILESLADNPSALYETEVVAKDDTVVIKTKKGDEVYRPEQLSADEVVHKFQGILKHSPGRAWQWLKKNKGEFVSGPEKNESCFAVVEDYVTADEANLVYPDYIDDFVVTKTDDQGREQVIEFTAQVQDEDRILEITGIFTFVDTDMTDLPLTSFSAEWTVKDGDETAEWYGPIPNTKEEFLDKVETYKE